MYSAGSERKLLGSPEKAYVKSSGLKSSRKGDGKEDTKEPKLTEEQIAANKKEKFAKSNAKAKEMIRELFETYKCQIIVGLLGNVIGMTAELVSPLYVGYIIDAIVAKQTDEIDRLVIIWMSITVASRIVNGL